MKAFLLAPGICRRFPGRIPLQPRQMCCIASKIGLGTVVQEGSALPCR